MGLNYSSDTYGSGVYGGVVLTPTPEPPTPDPGDSNLDLTDLLGPPRLPVHIVGVGPRSGGLTWGGAANYGKPPTVIGPGGPQMPLPNPTRMGFTLRRDGSAEATVEFSHPRGTSYVVKELVTDLWWRRHDPYAATSEPISRFNIDNVEMSCDTSRLTTSLTCVDYRELLNNRLNIEATVTYPAGTSMNTILANAIPDNIDINLDAIGAANLGVLTVPLEVAYGQSVGDIIGNLRDAGIYFDYHVGMAAADNGAGLPVLSLWPGGRAAATDVVLVDDGAGGSPIASWRRVTNGADYATTVIYTGQTHTSTATNATPTLPAGPRDYAERGNAGTQALADAAALRILGERSSARPEWSLTLRPGFWRGPSHIYPGDVITVIVRLGLEVISGQHLVEQITVDVDANTGQETVTLTVGKPRPSTNPRSRLSPMARIVSRLNTT